MTKANELRVLDKAIAELGKDSYLGPWLASVRANVDADMRSDFVPMLLPRDAEQMVAQMLEEARGEARDIRANAQATANVLVKQAQDGAATVRARLVRDLQQAVEAVSEGWR